MEQQKKWYDNRILTNILLLIFFPVGLYALWKSNTIAKWWKVTATIIIALIVISNLGLDSPNGTNSDTSETKDPLNIGITTVKALIGQKVPYDKWEDWGNPKTLTGTNNENWIVYLDSANISFVSNKSSDKILYADFGKTSALNYINERRQERKDLIESQFSSWDGSHRNLEKTIKQAMHDPESYKHIETKYWDKNDYLIVSTQYSGKNAFGGTVKGMIKAKISLDGDIVEILDQ